MLNEKKKCPNIVSILLYGSIARGTASKDSDVDIEIIYNKGVYKSKEEYYHGIKVDFEYWPKQKLLNRIKNYPFLSYPYLEEKILYDPSGFAKDIKNILKGTLKKTKKQKMPGKNG